MKQEVAVLFEELFSRYGELAVCRNDIAAAYACIVQCYRQKGKLLICGNGGSAADAEHVVGELMKSFKIKRKIPQQVQDRLCAIDPRQGKLLCEQLEPGLPAISLVSQTSLLTAFANDVTADLIFAQQVLGYGCPSDVLWAISTSGNSANICYAVHVAKALGIPSIGLTGMSGGKLKSLCDICICVPSEGNYKIQEYHLPVYHALCLMIETEFFGQHA